MTTLPIIDYTCYLNPSGYSQAALDTIFALEDSKKYDIRITCIHSNPQKTAFTTDTLSRLDKLIKKPTNEDATRIYHCIPDQHKRFERLKKNIAFATFETYDPPEHWIKTLNQCNSVICPSDFNYKIFAHSGVKKPLFHIPHSFNKNVWNESVIPLKKHERFTFLFVGTWRRRKGWPQLIEAWFREFKASDGVQLIIKTDKM